MAGWLFLCRLVLAGCLVARSVGGRRLLVFPCASGGPWFGGCSFPAAVCVVASAPPPPLSAEARTVFCVCFCVVFVALVLFFCYTRDLVFTVSVMFSPVVSSSVLELVSSFGAVAFSGGRSLVGPSLGAARWLCSSSSPASVLVGCAPGADAVARFAFPSASVFSVVPGSGRGGFAARSCRVVRACVGSSGLWVSFPSSSCPAGLLPSASSSRAFCGSGSGSWASLSFAVGSGVPCLVFLSPGIVPPVGWGFVALGSGWFVSRRPVAVQSSLF